MVRKTTNRSIIVAESLYIKLGKIKQLKGAYKMKQNS